MPGLYFLRCGPNRYLIYDFSLHNVSEVNIIYYEISADLIGFYCIIGLFDSCRTLLYY